MSSSWIRSATSISPSRVVSSVRRSSANLSPDGGDLRLDDVHQQALVGQDAAVSSAMVLFQLLVFLHELLPLQAGEAGQAHVQDGLGLLVGEAGSAR